MYAMRHNRSGKAIPRYETADIETSSDDYARRFAGSVGEWMLAVQERITLGMLIGVPRAAVLDVGGGHGQLAGPLCREGYPVTVVGSDESCRHRIAGLLADGRCRFVAGSLVALPFAERSFDAVISFRLLPHCLAWQALIRELCRVARHSVVVDYPTDQSLNALAPALFGAKRRLEGNTRTWRSFHHAEVAAEFQQNGFELQTRVPEFFFPMVMHRMLHLRGLSAALERMAAATGLTRRWGSPVIAHMRRA